jgi:hypothetical protein
MATKTQYLLDEEKGTITRRTVSEEPVMSVDQYHKKVIDEIPFPSTFFPDFLNVKGLHIHLLINTINQFALAVRLSTLFLDTAYAVNFSRGFSYPIWKRGNGQITEFVTNYKARFDLLPTDKYFYYYVFCFRKQNTGKMEPSTIKVSDWLVATDGKDVYHPGICNIMSHGTICSGSRNILKYDPHDTYVKVFLKALKLFQTTPFNDHVIGFKPWHRSAFKMDLNFERHPEAKPEEAVENTNWILSNSGINTIPRLHRYDKEILERK